jgi:predicted GH43/DUF377 family glycosyl hydrolase
MIRRLFNKRLLTPSDFQPSQPDLEVIGAFNPGAVATEHGVTLLVRIAEQAAEKRPGKHGLPRFDPGSGRVVIDWEEEHTHAPVDIRVVRKKLTGLVRLNFISHLRVIHSEDGRTIDSVEPVRFAPMYDYEEFGVEDPRITRIADTFYFTYVAVSRHGVATALASTRDFRKFERHGIIFYPENKDVVLFPEKIAGKYWALHRPNGSTPFTKPEMWLASSNDLISWGPHEHFLGGSAKWDIGRIGAGTPPLLVNEGWLEMYHGNSRGDEEQGIGTYSGGLLLLDRNNPRKILSGCGNVFVPESKFEKVGFVPDVVFPTGIVERGETVLIYYGAADTCTAVAEFSINDLLSALTKRL